MMPAGKRTASAASLTSGTSAGSTGGLSAATGSVATDPEEVEEPARYGVLVPEYTAAWLHWMGYGTERAYYHSCISDLYECGAHAGLTREQCFPKKPSNRLRHMENSGLILDANEEGLQRFRPSARWLTPEELAACPMFTCRLLKPPLDANGEASEHWRRH